MAATMTAFRLCLVGLALAACSVDNKMLEIDAGPAIDAEVMPDTQPVPPPSPGRDLTPAAGRLTGGAWTVDVQLGPIHQPASQTAAPLHP